MSDWYFKQDVERPGGRLGVHRLDPEQQQGPGPVERLRHRRRLFQLQIPDGAHDPDHLIGQGVGDAGHAGEHDLLLPLEVRIVDVEEEAAALEGLRQLPGVVGGEEDQGDLGGAHRPQLGDRHLVVGQDLQQQGFGLDLDAVHLVDEQHDRLVGPDGLQQGTGQEERLREDVLLDVGPVPPACLADPLGLDAQQLLLVVPLVQRLGLVETLVALQADQAGPGELGDRLGQLGLAGPCRPLDQHRLAQPLGQVDDAGDALVRQVGHPAQPLSDLAGGLESGRGDVAHVGFLPVVAGEQSTERGSSATIPNSRRFTEGRSTGRWNRGHAGDNRLGPTDHDPGRVGVHRAGGRAAVSPRRYRRRRPPRPGAARRARRRRRGDDPRAAASGRSSSTAPPAGRPDGTAPAGRTRRSTRGSRPPGWPSPSGPSPSSPASCSPARSPP